MCYVLCGVGLMERSGMISAPLTLSFIGIQKRAKLHGLLEGSVEPSRGFWLGADQSILALYVRGFL